MNKQSLSACDPSVNVFHRSVYGFVYVLGNDSMPGMYKIGFSSEHPQIRTTDLSAKSGCPTPFVLLAYFGCEHPRQVEQAFHEKFNEFRVTKIREFFKVHPAAIQAEFRKAAEEYGDAVYSHGLDVFCQFLEQTGADGEDGTI